MLVPTIAAFFFLIPTARSLCPPPGPILPPPTLTPNSSTFSILDAVFNNFTFLGDNSFAIKASIGNTTVFEYEHSAPGREVNQSLFETKIRIASATKLITALAIELSKDKISLEDPITKFIPGLKEEYYGDVTIKALTDHTSGLGRFVRPPSNYA
jgi:CubicO group peptidase (beta-lactamase class C family)